MNAIITVLLHLLHAANTWALFFASAVTAYRQVSICKDHCLLDVDNIGFYASIQTLQHHYGFCRYIVLQRGSGYIVLLNTYSVVYYSNYSGFSRIRLPLCATNFLGFSTSFPFREAAMSSRWAVWCAPCWGMRRMMHKKPQTGTPLLRNRILYVSQVWCLMRKHRNNP